MRMKGFAMLGIGKTGWIEKEVPPVGLWMPLCVLWPSPPAPRTSILSGKAPSANGLT